MTIVEDFLRSTSEWVNLNAYSIMFSAFVIVVIYIIYRFSVRQVTRLEDKKRLDETVSFILRRILKWGSTVIAVAIIIAQFGIEIDLVAGLMVLAGGTVIGFAAINTLGNAIAGIIVMVSRPFNINDRITYGGKFADIEEINLIYTKMRTLDNVQISVPNQELLKTDIENYGKKRIIRRNCTITASYDEKPDHVEKALMEASGKVKWVLEEPASYVWVSTLGKFGVDYTLYVFIDEIERINEIDANLNLQVLETCSQYSIDLRTPSLYQTVSGPPTM